MQRCLHDSSIVMVVHFNINNLKVICLQFNGRLSSNQCQDLLEIAAFKQDVVLRDLGSRVLSYTFTTTNYH